MAQASDEPLPAYAELQCVSNFTFLRGASHPEELVERAARLGYRSLALTDECSVAGVVRAHTEAKKAGLHLIIGSCFELTDDAGRPAFTLVILAQNREGYGNLCELITLGRTRASKGSYQIRLSDFTNTESEYSHLRGMPHCLAMLTPKHRIKEADLLQQAQWLRLVFPGRAWIALTLLHKSRDAQHRLVVEQVAQRLGLPVVATGDVCMHVRSRKMLQDTLTAVRLGKSIAGCGFALAPNAEQHLRSRLRLGNLYPPAALAETIRIADRCTFSLDELQYEYPDELVPAGDTPASYLRKETYTGAHRRFPDGIPPTVSSRLNMSWP